MSSLISITIIILLSLTAFYFGRKTALTLTVSGDQYIPLHSQPVYHGLLVVSYCAIPALLVFAVWHIVEPIILMNQAVSVLSPELRALPEDRLSLIIGEIKNIVHRGLVMPNADPAVHDASAYYQKLAVYSGILMNIVITAVAVPSGLFALRRINPELRARNRVEKIVLATLMLCAALAVFTTIGIVLSVLFEAIRFFKIVPPLDFLFGLEWRPQIAIRADQVGGSGVFGAVPIFAGTAMIATIAMLTAVPLGLMSAIYLSEYAHKNVRAVAKPLLEVLAGIPTVVYGFFAALTVAPFIRDHGDLLGINVSSESAAAAGLVMGIMILPFISSLADDVFTAVPKSLRDGAYALGATTSETIRQVVVPAALPGIIAGILLAISRAIGETMIVVMAAGLAANLTANPLEAVTTVTVQIVTLLVGDQEFDSPKTLAAFALGLVLFVITLILNIIALYVVRTYREKYE